MKLRVAKYQSFSAECEGALGQFNEVNTGPVIENVTRIWLALGTAAQPQAYKTPDFLSDAISVSCLPKISRNTSTVLDPFAGGA